MFVLTLTQRDGTTQGDRVDELLGALSGIPAAHPFARSWGDEAVGVVERAEDAVTAALAALRVRGETGHRWSVGIGVGPVRVSEPPEGAHHGRGAGVLAVLGVEREPEEASRIGGPGAARSRRAVERCPRTGVPLAVEAGPAGVGFEGVPSAPESAAAAEGVLRLLGELMLRRTATEWSVLDLLVPGVRGQQKEVAAALGVSVQAVSQAVARSRWALEWEARPSAALLLRLAAFAVD